MDGGDDEHPALGDAERKDGGHAGFAAPHGQLDDGFLLAGAEKLVGTRIGFALRFTKIRIVLDVGGRLHEVGGEVLVGAQPLGQCLLFVEPFLANLADR